MNPLASASRVSSFNETWNWMNLHHVCQTKFNMCFYSTCLSAAVWYAADKKLFLVKTSSSWRKMLFYRVILASRLTSLSLFRVTVSLVWLRYDWPGPGPRQLEAQQPAEARDSRLLRWRYQGSQALTQMQIKRGGCAVDWPDSGWNPIAALGKIGPFLRT